MCRFKLKKTTLKKMITFRILLKKLPLQKRLQAMENIRRDGTFMFLDYEKTLKSTLSGMFSFVRTKQGHDYWYNINEKYFS